MGQNWPQNQVFCHFLKFGSLVFLGIAYNDSLQQFLTSSTGKIYIKIFWAQIWGKGGQNQIRNQVFCHFLKFGSLDFLDIAYNDSLQQCIISSRGKTHEKNFWGPNLGQNGPKSGLKLQSWSQYFGTLQYFSTDPIHHK